MPLDLRQTEVIDLCGPAIAPKALSGSPIFGLEKLLGRLSLKHSVAIASAQYYRSIAPQTTGASRDAAFSGYGQDAVAGVAYCRLRRFHCGPVSSQIRKPQHTELPAFRLGCLRRLPQLS